LRIASFTIGFGQTRDITYLMPY